MNTNSATAARTTAPALPRLVAPPSAAHQITVPPPRPRPPNLPAALRTTATRETEGGPSPQEEEESHGQALLSSFHGLARTMWRLNMKGQTPKRNKIEANKDDIEKHTNYSRADPQVFQSYVSAVVDPFGDSRANATFAEASKCQAMEAAGQRDEDTEAEDESDTKDDG
ncbi:hypothetical protein PG991_010810 [Apiospora marii]|uniref:Uncharacterized protein n=1 Tax=Apiospora marii TaxID=335849 RepID=A0ABR1RCG7_9PEZI